MTPGALQERTTALPADPASAGAARRFVAAFLADVGRPEWAEAAELAVSEVVTNAVLHAHTDLVLTALTAGDSVRVEVQDRNPSFPSPRRYDEQATTGRGMALVAAITRQHGVTSLGPEGKVVWFTVCDTVAEEADLLAAWGDLDEVADEARPGAVLLGVPPTLWAAARQHHDALVRELTLVRAARGASTDDLALADEARRAVSDAIETAVVLAAAQGVPAPVLPTGHPSPLPAAPGAVDAVVPDALPARVYAVLQDVLDEAEVLAARGELLVRPGLPEVVAVRDWACEQVIAQLGGTAPSAWPGTDAERFTDLLHDGDLAAVHAEALGIASSDRGAVLADDANRIVAISPPLCQALGLSADDVVGRRVVVLVPHRYREAHVAGFTRHLTTGEAHALGVDLELPVLRADGSEVRCRFLIEASGTAAGRSLYTAWITPIA